MSIKFDCIYCDKELNEPGAILLSPPDECTYDCEIDSTCMWGDEDFCKEEKINVKT